MCIDRTSIRSNYSEDSFVSRRGSDDWGDSVSKCWKIFGRAFFKQYDVRVPDTCTFEHAYSLLDGNDGMASKYGAIHYYEDTDIEKWCPELVITKTLGIRTFWDMQQNQEIHKDADWQDKMVEIEMRVSDMNGYKDIAFFHHLMFENR